MPAHPDEASVDTALDRFGMTRLASLDAWPGKDIGLRVLRADSGCRWSLELSHASTRWFVQLWYAGPSPGDDVLRELRATLYPLVSELGRTLTDERVGPGLARHWMRARPPRTDTTQAFVLYRAELGGHLGRATLDEFRDDLGIEKVGRRHEEVDGEYGGDDYFGDVYLADDVVRVRLSLQRHHDGWWYLILCYAGLPPSAASLGEMTDRIRTATARAGLTIVRESDS